MLTIQMMGGFSITVDGKETAYLVSRTRKGAALMEYLILNHGKQVPKQRLLRVLWSDGAHVNPENAMKTLISRLRKQLDEIHEGLGNCIVSGRGRYFWESLPGMKIDLLDIMRIFEELPREKEEEKRCYRYRQLMCLYTGDLFLTGDIKGGGEYQAALHRAYLNAMYEYIGILIRKMKYNRIVDVCEKAMRVVPHDERLSMELTLAQREIRRSGDVLLPYQERENTDFPEENKEAEKVMWDRYYEALETGNALQNQLDSMIVQLSDSRKQQGAYVCGVEEFRHYYRLMTSTLERLGCPMFLGIISLEQQSGLDSIKVSKDEQKEAMNHLMDILRNNLRRGDVVTSGFSSTAMILLPTVNYTTGNMILERIRSRYFEKNTGSSVPFHYQLKEIRE